MVSSGGYPGWQRLGAGFFLEGDAGQTEASRHVHEPTQPGCGLVVGESRGWPDVGNAVTLAVDPTDARLPREIDAQAVGGGKSGPLTYQQDGQSRSQALTDLIPECDAGMACHDDGPDLPTRELRKRCGKHRRGMFMDCAR